MPLDQFPKAVLTAAQTGRLPQKILVVSQFWRRKSQIRCWQSWFRLRAVRENLSHASLLDSGDSGDPPRAVTYRCIPPITASSFSCSPPPVSSHHLPLRVSCLLSFKGLNNVKLGPTLISCDFAWTWSHLQSPYYQTRSHYRHQELGFQYMFWGDTVQLIIHSNIFPIYLPFRVIDIKGLWKTYSLYTNF